MSRPSRAVELPEVTISESRGVRYLHLDTPWIQGAMRIDDPLVIELEYVQRMMAWMLFCDPANLAGARAVQLGLGAAAITRLCLSLGMRTTAVEINPQVVAACRTWFRLPVQAYGLEVLTLDAAEFVADVERAGSADVLAVDLYDHEAASPVLDSEAFYRGCQALLADGGLMTVNLFGRDASFERSRRRIAAAFGADAVHEFKPTREGNVVVLAMKHVTVPGLDELARRAENIQTRCKLPARKWLRMLRLHPEPDPAPLPDLPPA
ncbi:MAG TPA: spermidine synthase [Caldimonas sp.]|jgi:spermidine synthase|nr:spermidine synthase [Caldimonas sp.]HEX2541942.1 spermidine synthase [Caldimonas sp.]